MYEIGRFLTIAMMITMFIAIMACDFSMKAQGKDLGSTIAVELLAVGY